MPENPPIVNQERVGDLAQLSAGRFIRNGHWLVARIATGSHQRTARQPHQGSMQRRVGDERSHGGKSRCNLLG